jgi:hypothetical protein
MAGYKCAKCGADADSKCVYSRSIFLDDPSATILTHMLKRTVEPHRDGYNKYVFTFSTISKDEFHALKGLMNLLSAPGAMINYACDHDWVLQAEKCELGCCHRKKELG